MSEDLGRTGNTRRNLVWGIAGKAVTVLGPFVVRAVLIRQLGAEYLGVSSLFTSILQVLSLAELGFSSAVVFGMYKPVAEGDVRGVAAYLNYFRVVYRVVGAVILALGLVTLPFLGTLVRGEPPAGVDIRIAFLIYVANTALSYFLFAYKQSLLTAYQRSDLVSRVTILSSLALCMMQVTVLLMHPDFYSYAFALPLSTVLSNVAVAWVVSKEMPEFSERSLRAERLGAAERADMRRRIAGIMVSRVCNVTRNSLDSIVISAFMGLASVAAYGNYLTVVTGVHGVLGIAGASMTAAVGNSIVTESREKNFSDLRVFVLLYAGVSAVCSAVMLSCLQPFVALWVGEGLVLPFSVPALMVAYFYVLTMGDMRAVYADAAGIWWEQRWRALAEAVANVVLNLALVRVMGLEGVVLATLLSLFFLNFVYGSHLVFRHYFGMEHARRYYLDHVAYASAAFAACALSYYLAGLVPVGGVFSLIAKAAVSAAVTSATFCLLTFKAKTFGAAVSMLRRVFGVGG